jgi:hypothetical protein
MAVITTVGDSRHVRSPREVVPAFPATWDRNATASEFAIEIVELFCLCDFSHRGIIHATTRVHHAFRWRGNDVAARGARRSRVGLIVSAYWYPLHAERQ